MPPSSSDDTQADRVRAPRPESTTVTDLHRRPLQVVCRVPRDRLYRFRHTLEAHEGVCLASTLAGGDGRVRLLTSRDRAEELEHLLAELAREMPVAVETWDGDRP